MGKLMTLTETLREKFAFDGLAVVAAAVKDGKEYFTPATDYTAWGDKPECYEHGFYGGAKFERERFAPIHAALIECVSALELVVRAGENAKYPEDEHEDLSIAQRHCCEALTALKLACAGELESNPESKSGERGGE